MKRTSCSEKGHVLLQKGELFRSVTQVSVHKKGFLRKGLFVMKRSIYFHENEFDFRPVTLARE